jgi:protein required for attachment to host cells
MRCRLQGWQRQGENLAEIIPINDWTSPRLGVRFIWNESSLELYRPDGEKFLTTVELESQMRQEKQRADKEKKRADKEKKRADKEKKRADRLAERLQALGLGLEEE